MASSGGHRVIIADDLDLHVLLYEFARLRQRANGAGSADAAQHGVQRGEATRVRRGMRTDIPRLLLTTDDQIQTGLLSRRRQPTMTRGCMSTASEPCTPRPCGDHTKQSAHYGPGPSTAPQPRLGSALALGGRSRDILLVVTSSGRGERASRRAGPSAGTARHNSGYQLSPHGVARLVGLAGLGPHSSRAARRRQVRGLRHSYRD